MGTIRHAHSSSLYSNSADSLADQVERAVEAEDPDATTLTFTEVGSTSRTEVLKDADPDEWAAWVPDQSDVGIMWRKDEFGPLWKEPKKLTGKIWTDGQGRDHETWAASGLFQHRTSGKTMFLSVCHLPSHVQDGDHFYDNAQARAWKDAVNNGWHTYWNDVRTEDHPDVGILTGDWNIDVHMSEWIQYVQDVFPSMYCTWAGDREPPNDKGTHGDRLIDFSMSTSKPSKAKLLKDDSSSDHRPFGEAIPWP
jgi:hypothetical protein